MNFVIDVGNTTIQMAIFKDNSLFKDFILPTKEYKEEEFLKIITIVKGYDINHVVYSSVVPNLDGSIIDILSSNFKCDISNIKSVSNILSMRVKNPDEVGADLLADIYSAIKEKKYPCVIVDLGTANKFLLVDDKGEFITCLIAPGMMSSYDALFGDAALLSHIEINEIPDLLSIKETKGAVVGGLIYSTLESVKGICDRYEKKLGYKLNKIVTGGNATYIKELLQEDYEYDKTLLLRGLNYFAKEKL